MMCSRQKGTCEYSCCTFGDAKFITQRQNLFSPSLVKIPETTDTFQRRMETTQDFDGESSSCVSKLDTGRTEQWMFAKSRIYTVSQYSICCFLNKYNQSEGHTTRPFAWEATRFRLERSSNVSPSRTHSQHSHAWYCSCQSFQGTQTSRMQSQVPFGAERMKLDPAPLWPPGAMSSRSATQEIFRKSRRSHRDLTGNFKGQKWTYLVRSMVTIWTAMKVWSSSFRRTKFSAEFGTRTFSFCVVHAPMIYDS